MFKTIHIPCKNVVTRSYVYSGAHSIYGHKPNNGQWTCFFFIFVSEYRCDDFRNANILLKKYNNLLYYFNFLTVG